MTTKKTVADITLDAILTSPQTLQTGIGPIEIGEFKFKHISRINPLVVEIAQFLDFENLTESLPRILYIFFRDDSEAMQLMVEFAVQNKTIEEIGELGTKDTIALYKMVFQVAVMRYVEEIKAELGKLVPQSQGKPSATNGRTPSRRSAAT